MVVKRADVTSTAVKAIKAAQNGYLQPTYTAVYTIAIMLYKRRARLRVYDTINKYRRGSITTLIIPVHMRLYIRDKRPRVIIPFVVRSRKLYTAAYYFTYILHTIQCIQKVPFQPLYFGRKTIYLIHFFFVFQL